MSEAGSFWLMVAEKFFGFLLVAIGALMAYYTTTSSAVLGVFSGFFGFLSAVVLLVGLFLLVVRPE